MATYTKTTDFLAKDSLPLNNAAKYVKGSEIDTEYNNIATADADNMKKSAMGTGVETFLGTPSSANLAAAVTGETGTGALVFATSPTLVTPALGTPASGVLTNCTGTAAGLTSGVASAVAVGGITGLGANVDAFLATPSSANLAAAVTDETGSGVLVLATAPTLVTPVLGVASATSINKLAITAPATSATLAIADGKTLTVSNTMTLTGTDSTSYDLDRSKITLTSTTSTSGAFDSVDITGIPSGVKEIKVNVASVSYTGVSADDFQLLLGDSGGIETSSYLGLAFSASSSGTLNTGAFYLTDGVTTGVRVFSGIIILSLQESSSNTWVMSSTLANDATTVSIHWAAGKKSLSGELTQLRFRTLGGTDFDGGSISLSYS